MKKIFLLSLLMSGVMGPAWGAVPNSTATITTSAMGGALCNQRAVAQVKGSSFSNRALVAMGINSIAIECPAYYNNDLFGPPHDGLGNGNCIAQQDVICTVRTNTSGDIIAPNILKWINTKDTNPCEPHEIDKTYVAVFSKKGIAGCGETASVNIEGVKTDINLIKAGIKSITINGPTYYNDSLANAPHNGSGDGESSVTQTATVTIDIDGYGNVSMSTDFSRADSSIDCTAHSKE